MNGDEMVGGLAAYALDKFEQELAAYKSAKGSVQFPLDKPMPLTLIKKMVQYKVKELSALTTKSSKR
jgi:uncharacterized protein YdhG (YjbR/CyaY superfamily)